MDRLNTRIIGQRRNREDRAAAEREGVGAAAKSAVGTRTRGCEAADLGLLGAALCVVAGGFVTELPR